MKRFGIPRVGTTRGFRFLYIATSVWMVGVLMSTAEKLLIYKMFHIHIEFRFRCQ